MIYLLIFFILNDIKNNDNSYLGWRLILFNFILFLFNVILVSVFFYFILLVLVYLNNSIWFYFNSVIIRIKWCIF